MIRRRSRLAEADASTLIGAFHLDAGEQLVAHVHLAGPVVGAPVKEIGDPAPTRRDVARQAATSVAGAARDHALGGGPGMTTSRLVFGRGGCLWAGSAAAGLHRALVVSVDRPTVWPQLVVTNARVLLVGLAGPAPGARPAQILRAQLGGERLAPMVLWTAPAVAVGVKPRRWVRRRRLRLVFADRSWLEVLPYRGRRADAARVRSALRAS